MTQPRTAAGQHAQHAPQDADGDWELQSTNGSPPATPGNAPATPPTPDLKPEASDDPLAAAQYVGDMLRHYRRVEPWHRVATAYLSKQAYLNDNMRAVLVDWLVEVHSKHDLLPETLFLAVNIVDRFLERKPVIVDNLQLVGMAALLIASKYDDDEGRPLGVRKLMALTCLQYTRKQILGMEKLILTTLRFNMAVPTAHTFFELYTQTAGITHEGTAAYAAYLLQLSLVDASMLEFSYSMVAAAAIHVACEVTNTAPAYSHGLAKHARFAEAAIRPCMRAVADLPCKVADLGLTAVLEKYSDLDFKMAACPAGV